MTDAAGEYLLALKRAGWSVGSCAFVEDGKPFHVVTAWMPGRGEVILTAHGSTDAEAWRNAAGQAWSLGMLGRVRVGEPLPG